MASKKWLRAFLERNQCVQMEGKALAVNRQMGLQQSTVETWYSALKNEHDLHEKALVQYWESLPVEQQEEIPLEKLREMTRINFDETIFSNGRSMKTAVIARKGSSGRSVRTPPATCTFFVAILEAIDATGRCVGSCTFFNTDRVLQQHMDAVQLLRKYDPNGARPLIANTGSGANNEETYVRLLRSMLRDLDIRVKRPGIPLMVCAAVSWWLCRRRS
mgnify:CR=1 FL=1